MWICKVCRFEIEDDSWKVCWNCGNEKDISDEKLKTAREELRNYQNQKQQIAETLQCVRCGSRLRFLGTKKFHEGASWGFWLGNLGELLVNRVALDQFFCPRCGKVEFFLEQNTLDQINSKFDS